MAKSINAFGDEVGSFDLASSSLTLKASATGLDLSVHATLRCRGVDHLHGLCGWVELEAGTTRNARDAWIAPVTGNFVTDPTRSNDAMLTGAIDERVIERIERDRLVAGADVTLRFWLSVVAQRAKLAEVAAVVEQVVISRSKWGDMLREAGFGAALLHRFPPVAFGSTYSLVVDRFRAAERGLLNGDYDSAVVACRTALDQLATAAGLGTKFDQPTADKVFAAVADSEVRTALHDFSPKLRALLNRGPHPSGAGYEAAEARYVVALTAATLHYLGEWLPKPVP